MASTRITFPIGRLIGGSVDKMFPNYEQDGKTPKIGRDGKPTMSVSFGVAIPKAGEQHWAQTQWGAPIYEIGKIAEPLMHQTPTFAWKINDGDSTLPNKRGKIPREQVGHAGHWIIWFKQGWLPKIVNADGSVELPEGSIVPGYYVQVAADVASNGAKPPNTPGLYMNPVAVALAGVGEKIITDVDTSKLGFGGALPAGAQPVPKAFDMGGTGTAPVTPTAPAPTPVPPNPAFMAPPAAPAVPQMTAKANGATYEQFRAQGWTDEAMRAQGYML